MKQKINKKRKSAKKTRLNKFQNTKKRGGGRSGRSGYYEVGHPEVRHPEVRHPEVERPPSYEKAMRGSFSGSEGNVLNPSEADAEARGYKGRVDLYGSDESPRERDRRDRADAMKNKNRFKIEYEMRLLEAQKAEEAYIKENDARQRQLSEARANELAKRERKRLEYLEHVQNVHLAEQAAIARARESAIERARESAIERARESAIAREESFA
jgi:hypothetical protein